LAFEQLLQRYLKPIYNFLYQITRDSAALDDLTQETFIKVWKNIARFDQSKIFKVWIFAIAKNTAYDFLKKRKTIPFSFFENGEGNSFIENIAGGRFPLGQNGDHAAPGDILEKLDLEKDIEEVLNKIPVHYRTILVMRYKEDFSLKEIAEILRKPYNTVKSQHQRALRALKWQMKKQ